MSVVGGRTTPFLALGEGGVGLAALRPFLVLGESGVGLEAVRPFLALGEGGVGLVGATFLGRGEGGVAMTADGRLPWDLRTGWRSPDGQGPQTYLLLDVIDVDNVTLHDVAAPVLDALGHIASWHQPLAHGTNIDEYAEISHIDHRANHFLALPQFRKWCPKVILQVLHPDTQ